MARLVHAGGFGHRGAALAALSLGAGERRRAATLWAADSRQRACAVRRRSASLRLLAGAGRFRRQRNMITDRVTYEQLLGISGCLALALLAHITTLPLWVPGIVVACGLIRLGLARSGRGPLPGSVLVTVAVLVVPLLLVRFHTFNGLVAGTALLSVTAGLKLLETKTQRDVYIITLIIYFVSLAALLEGDSFWLLAYLIGVCWLTTATLLRLTTTLPIPDWRRSLRYAGKILGQALPVAVGVWLFFPRFAAPLWHIPDSGHSAESGISDTMSPGDIDQLAQSDDVAFRVHFAAATP